MLSIRTVSVCSITIVLLLQVSSLLAEESAAYRWQKARLMNPDKEDIQNEKQKQKIFIYESMKLSDVEKALDKHFDRMDYMMFIGTLLPPTAAGGEPEKEEDGCE